MSNPFDPVRNPICPKCGSDDVGTSYVERVLGYGCSRTSCRKSGEGEHFHRTCRYCWYEWPTFDVKGTKAEPLQVRPAVYDT